MSRILVLEDSAKLRELLRETLEAAGHEVTEAPDGDAGLKQFRRAPADLVITDIFMPEKDGLDVIQELRVDFPGVKIIAVSSGGRHEKDTYLLAASRMGADRVIEKPFEMQDLAAAVQQLLR